MRRYDLLRLPLVKPLLISRWPQLIIQIGLLGSFLLAILAGLLGTPVGNRNLSIVFVWILWWVILILLSVPFTGRGWCSVCPIPLVGEWLQRGAVLGPPGAMSRRFGLGRRWPRKLRNIWLPNATFTLLALFSALVLTQPHVTALVLLGILLIATAVGVIYERRAFCRYLCPVSGFIGLYSQMAPLELRVRDTSICAGHQVKTCYSGDVSGYGCPWNVFPGSLVKNVNCGTCMECLRVCPYDNIGFFVRPAGADLAQPRDRRLDEAFKTFIMLGSAIVYAAVMLGPWGEFKSAAFSVGAPIWWVYAAVVLGFVFAVLPGVFYLAVKAGRALAPTRLGARQSFIAWAYSLIPLGLAAWVAFTFSFAFANFSYVWPVLSDPMGWGWDLFGTAVAGWQPYITGLVPTLQSGVLLVGLAWSTHVAFRIATENAPREARARGVLPVMLYCVLITVGLLWLFVG